MRDLILNAQDRQLKPVEVPEWGVTVYLRQLSVGDRLALFDVLSDEQNANKILYVYAIIFTVCDSSGQRIFTVEDYESIVQKNADVILRLGKECATFNRLLADAVPEAKKV